jgi:hypothetical protein
VKDKPEDELRKLLQGFIRELLEKKWRCSLRQGFLKVITLDPCTASVGSREISGTRTRGLYTFYYPMDTAMSLVPITAWYTCC